MWFHTNYITLAIIKFWFARCLQQVSQEDESNYDAYIIVFSVTDRSSFDVAAFLLRHLRVEVGTDRAIIVVANKVDLVRQRRVSNSGQCLDSGMAGYIDR